MFTDKQSKKIIGHNRLRLIRTDKNGNKTIHPTRYEEAIEKINCIMEYLQVMARNGNMDGGQIVPLEIITQGGNGEKFTRKTNKLRIQRIKSKTLYSRYTVENLLEYFYPIAETA